MTKKKSFKEIFFILENFHPIPLFVCSVLMYLIIQKMLIDIPFFQKVDFLIFAGTIYFISIVFESYRIVNKKKQKIKHISTESKQIE